MDVSRRGDQARATGSSASHRRLDWAAYMTRILLLSGLLGLTGCGDGASRIRGEPETGTVQFSLTQSTDAETFRFRGVFHIVQSGVHVATLDASADDDPHDHLLPIGPTLLELQGANYGELLTGNAAPHCEYVGDNRTTYVGCTVGNPGSFDVLAGDAVTVAIPVEFHFEDETALVVFSTGTATFVLFPSEQGGLCGESVCAADELCLDVDAQGPDCFDDCSASNSCTAGTCTLVDTTGGPGSFSACL